MTDRVLVALTVNGERVDAEAARLHRGVGGCGSVDDSGKCSAVRSPHNRISWYLVA